MGVWNTGDCFEGLRSAVDADVGYVPGGSGRRYGRYVLGFMLWGDGDVVVDEIKFGVGIEWLRRGGLGG